MTDRPILFSAPMIRAILREIKEPTTGKTQTRRVTETTRKPIGPGQILVMEGPRFGGTAYRFEPRYRVGDRLWVREAWAPHSLYDHMPPRDMPRSKIFYLADESYSPSGSRGRPGIHMPRWASRLTLIVTDVRVQRLHDIDDADAAREGVECREGMWGTWNADGTLRCGGADNPREAFRCLWININGTGSWDENPFVVAITFRPILANIDTLAEAA